MTRSDMRLRDARKASVVASAAAATVLMMAGAAFACTQLLGTISITANNGTGNATYGGNGKDNTDSTRGYCSTPTSRVALANADPLDVTLDFTLDVTRTSSCLTTQSLDEGDYEVRWVKAEETIDWTWPYPYCGTDREVNPDNLTNAFVVLDTITVTASGGSKSISLPIALQGPGNICLYNGTNYAPPHIYMKWTVI
jgi:hypothetical protein